MELAAGVAAQPTLMVLETVKQSRRHLGHMVVDGVRLSRSYGAQWWLW